MPEIRVWSDWLGRMLPDHPLATIPAVPAPSDFGKKVAETYREIKKDVAGKSSVDPQVKEQVNADLDRLIEKHGAR